MAFKETTRVLSIITTQSNHCVFRGQVKSSPVPKQVHQQGGGGGQCGTLFPDTVNRLVVVWLPFPLARAAAVVSLPRREAGGFGGGL